MSTLYDITLTIQYLYDSPAGSSRTLLRMMPRTLPHQRVITGLVAVDPDPSYRQDGKDFFGNHTVELAHDTPLSELSFRFSGRVESARPPAGLDLSTVLAKLSRDVEEIADIGPDTPHHFCARSERVRDVPEIAAYARALTRPDMSSFDAAQTLSTALHAEFDFDPTATDVTTDPAVAFRNRRGVCQDISHVMIAGLRSIGVPAGYVSGFLRTVPPKGQPRLEGADAMHAWVRAWCGHETGWVEFDPTNAMLAGSDHVVVAYGRDYADVAPVKGSLRSAGPHETRHFVDVVPVDPA